MKHLGSVALGLCLLCPALAANFNATTDTVGRHTNGLVTPVNQIVTPAGLQVDLPKTRPNALALSPDGAILVTAGLTNQLIVIDPATGTFLQQVGFPTDRAAEPAPVSQEILNPNSKAQLSFTGLIFSPDGSRIFLSNVNGDIKVFAVDRKHTVTPLHSFALPPAHAPRRTNDIPAGLAVSPDGKTLYVAGNLSNHLLELAADTGAVLRIHDVGVAPFHVIPAGKKIYVSNWGGRRPDTNSLTGPAGRGTIVRVDDRSIANDGSVSIIDPNGGTNVPAGRNEIITGLHPSAMTLSPNEKYLVVANAGSDTLTVIDTRTDKIVETISARQNPGDPFGAQPDALAFDHSGKRLYVCNGTQNAVAVFQFQPGQSKMLGLIPVGWFPAAIRYDARQKKIYVANLKNIGSRPEPARNNLGLGPGFNSKQYLGSLSLVPVPTDDQLQKLTQTALANLRYPLLVQARLSPRPDQPPVPVPERAGERSVFQHVIYIIKENRTYDQVLGDVPEGDGHAGLCVFGERITPNEHKLVRDFALLDNTYCSGVLSADGHQWTDTAIATDYIEREFAGFPRSYPSGGGDDDKDALAYSPAGFIWNNALRHGRSVVDFGEFTTAHNHWRDPARKDPIRFLDHYNDSFGHSNAIVYRSEPDLEALRPYIVTNWPSWDLNVPDQVRATLFCEQLARYEASNNLPNLVILWLPNDHTSGTKANAAAPTAQVADNDLALGRIVEAVSHSRFWTNTCIFAIEDDPQNGWDHVSGYRTTAYVASPYTRRRAVVHTQYNQTSLLRTIELMLGLPPMNQMDATATPMFDCFTNQPDFTAFNAVPNLVPLNEINRSARDIQDAQLKKDALMSARLKLDEADQCPEDVLNRILWHTLKGKEPYPAWAVKVVDDD